MQNLFKFLNLKAIVLYLFRKIFFKVLYNLNNTIFLFIVLLQKSEFNYIFLQGSKNKNKILIYTLKLRMTDFSISIEKN